jgi:hypothetical protein
VKSKQKKRRKLYIITLCLVILCMTGSVFSLVEYGKYSAQYHTDLALGQKGAQHLQSALTLLQALKKNYVDVTSLQKAQHEFSLALTTLNQLEGELHSLPGWSVSLPVYGTRLQAAFDILPIAIETSQVGIVACSTLNMLVSRLHDPLNTREQSFSGADLATVNQNFQQIKTTLDLIISQVNHLQPDDLQLDPRLSKLVSTFHKDLPTLQISLNEAEQLLPAIPTILGIGKPTNYLIEVLDSTELRPGGGFIGNYGIATLSGGRLTATYLTDTYLLDKPFVASGHSIPFPGAYSWFNLSTEGWSLRDSNLDADFPTAARFGEENYMREGGNTSVQGVLAITPTLIQKALTITGPISIPEYHEVITAQNLVARIHYYQLGPSDQGNSLTPSSDGLSSQRKHFTALLAKDFMTRMRQLPSSALSRLLQVLFDSIRTKDLQIYFNLPLAENTLRQIHLDGAVQSPTYDSLFVVDANISPNKANSMIVNTLDDQITLDGSGNATHHATLTYRWTGNGLFYGSSVYRDYVRVYMPPGSIVNAQDGWQSSGKSEAFGREVWGGFFTLTSGQVRTITIVWTAPNIAKKKINSWNYQYLIQRQAGAQWTLHLQIKLPSCSRISGMSGGLHPGTAQGTAVLTMPLQQDTSPGITYVC